MQVKSEHHDMAETLIVLIGVASLGVCKMVYVCVCVAATAYSAVILIHLESAVD